MRRRLLILLTISLALPAGNASMAQQETAQDETLGRLFYTARERAALNANIVRVKKQPAKPVPIPPSVTLNGVVTRSDGERTVWIDGRPYHRGNPDDMRVITRPEAPGVAELKLPGVANQRPVRVGQQLDPASGKTFESYEPRPTPARTQRSQPVDAPSGAEPASSQLAE
jgi:hypothetical protein